MDIDDRIIAVKKSFGLDYTDLAPEGEAHFDPVTLSAILASHILYAVGAGITDGIKEAAKDGTVAVLRASAKHIKMRLVPQVLHRFFKKPISDADLDASKKKADEALSSAAASAASLDADLVAQIATETAKTVAGALHDEGLKDSAAERVRREIEVQVKITLTPAA